MIKPAGLDFCFSEYLLNLQDEVIHSFVTDHRIKAAGVKTNCNIELTKRILNRKVNGFKWVKYSILRITGPDEASIRQCNKIIERVYPPYKYRKEYFRRAPVVLYTGDVVPDNTSLYYSRQRTGRTAPVCGDVRVESPFEIGGPRNPSNVPWKGTKFEEAGVYYPTTLGNENLFKFYNLGKLDSRPLHYNKEGVFDPPLISPHEKRGITPVCIRDYQAAGVSKHLKNMAFGKIGQMPLTDDDGQDGGQPESIGQHPPPPSALATSYGMSTPAMDNITYPESPQTRYSDANPMRYSDANTARYCDPNQSDIDSNQSASSGGGAQSHADEEEVEHYPEIIPYAAVPSSESKKHCENPELGDGVSSVSDKSKVTSEKLSHSERSRSQERSHRGSRSQERSHRGSRSQERSDRKRTSGCTDSARSQHSAEKLVTGNSIIVGDHTRSTSRSERDKSLSNPRNCSAAEVIRSERSDKVTSEREKSQVLNLSEDRSKLRSVSNQSVPIYSNISKSALKSEIEDRSVASAPPGKPRDMIHDDRLISLNAPPLHVDASRQGLPPKSTILDNRPVQSSHISVKKEVVDQTSRIHQTADFTSRLQDQPVIATRSLENIQQSTKLQQESKRISAPQNRMTQYIGQRDSMQGRTAYWGDMIIKDRLPLAHNDPVIIMVDGQDIMMTGNTAVSMSGNEQGKFVMNLGTEDYNISISGDRKRLHCLKGVTKNQNQSMKSKMLDHVNSSLNQVQVIV